MVYKRKFNRRRPQPKPRGSRLYKYARAGFRGAMAVGKTAATAIAAYKLAHRLADAVNTEYKEHQVISSVQTPPNTGTLYTLNNPPQGDAFNERIGDSIKCQNLTLRGKIMPPSSGSSAEFIRQTIFWDKTNNITAGSDLWNNAGGVLAPFSQKAEATKFQSKIVYDHTYKLVPNTTADAQNFTIVIPLNKHTHFSPASITIEDYALKMCLISDAGVGNVSTHLVSFDSIVSYTDN